MRTLLLATVLLLALTLPAARRPNVVLIFSDDQGVHDVGCYGSEIPTPNIDRIAREGMKFDRWYSASSICTPSRFGLLTGRNPSRSQHQLLSALMFMADEHRATGIQPRETTVAEKLRAAGYDTALIGKWHLGHGTPNLLPTRHGFDTFIGHTGGCIDYFTMTYGRIPDWYHQEEHVTEWGYSTELITDEAVKFLKERQKTDKPFFLYLPYNAPHFGKGWSPKDNAPMNIMQARAADLKRASGIDDKVRREFAAMVIALDDGVGRVMDALAKRGLDRDTLLVFLTDHGGDPVYGGSNHPLRGNKATLFDGGLKVPCVMRWPGQIQPGSVSDSLVWSIDLFPTLCALAGVSTEGLPLDGRDLGPVLFDQARWTDRTFFWETGTHSELQRGSWAALRQGDWKYVRSPTEGEFLFNMATDPNEHDNLAARKPEKFATLKAESARMAKHLRN
jgi:arylsulfatase A-like enzyme